MRIVNTDKVAVSGAGIAGLCAAILLLGKDFDITVYEESLHLRKDGGCIQIPSSFIKYFDVLGVKTEFLTKAIDCGYILSNHRELLFMDNIKALDNIKSFINQRIYSISRRDLYDILLNKVNQLNSNCINTSASIERFVETDKNISLYFKNSEQIECDFIIGADGVRSNIRKSLTDTCVIKNPNIGFGYVNIKLASDYDLSLYMRPYLYSSNSNWLYSLPMFLNKDLYITIFVILKNKDFGSYDIGNKGNLDDLIGGFKDLDYPVRNLLENVSGNYYCYNFLEEKIIKSKVSARSLLIGDAAKSYVNFIGFGTAMAIKNTIETIQQQLLLNNLKS
ncbi:FAD-dependent monooxygenase [Francisella sp. 19X1-34]|uniref:FAD-dependent oxidoreductase n=1 Tax=Francisella sp. 19X1-34 TaxID=3087177 RepID=UPI002E33647B|nr:FAD-dependent monooxygenase [Francisella sp. 19X1-34]MED7788182.1 FAD-dependent monooxygenase [Francisella sp. 19X1-34]